MRLFYSVHLTNSMNFQFFKLDLLGENDKILSEKQIYKFLSDILKSSNTRSESVGILTTEHRDTWGKVYQKLVKGR